MKDPMFYFSGINGDIAVDDEYLTITKTGEKTISILTDNIPLSSLTAVQFHEGKLLSNGYIKVSTKDDPSEVSIFATVADDKHAVLVSRKDSREAQKFCDQVEEYLYEHFFNN